MEENRMRRHTVIDPHRQTPCLQVDSQKSELDEESISIVTLAFDRLHGQLRLEFCSIPIISTSVSFTGAYVPRAHNGEFLLG